MGELDNLSVLDELDDLGVLDDLSVQDEMDVRDFLDELDELDDYSIQQPEGIHPGQLDERLQWSETEQTAAGSLC